MAVGKWEQIGPYKSPVAGGPESYQMRPYSEWRMIDGKEHLFEVEEYTASGFQTYWKRRDTGTVKGEGDENDKDKKKDTPATQAVPLSAEEVKTTATGPVGPQYRTFGPENLQLSTWGSTPGGGNPNEMYQLLKAAQAEGYPNAMDLWTRVPHNAIPGYRQWQRAHAAAKAGLPRPVSQGVPPAPPAPPAPQPPANGGATNGGDTGGLKVTGGIEERKLAHKITSDAANQAYLRARLNFESDTSARAAALQAAGQQIERVVQARRFGLELGEFLLEARGPRNYGQYFNVLGGDAAGAGLPSRLETVMSGLGRIAGPPNFEVPAGVDLGFGNVLRSMFGGTPMPGAGTAAQPVAQPVAQPTVSPSRIDPTQFARLLPSEQQAVVSMGEAAGIPAQDFLVALERSLPGAIPVGTPRQGLSSLRL